MSLAEKWEELEKELRLKRMLRPHTYWPELREAFYAGAEAALTEEYKSGKSDFDEIEAEIDHFRSHK